MKRPRTAWARRLVELYLDLRDSWGIVRRQREMFEKTREREAELMEHRPAISRVGPAIKPHLGGFTIPEGWMFKADEYWVTINQGHLVGPLLWMDGKVRAFGYTQQELQEIHARRAEFNVEV